jgi:hypothetical protein
MSHCPPSLPLYETDLLILCTGPLKKQSCSGGTRVARDLENIDDKPAHGVAHDHFEAIILTSLTTLPVPKRDLIVLASFLNCLFNVINNENDINDEAIHRIKKNQGV